MKLKSFILGIIAIVYLILFALSYQVKAEDYIFDLAAKFHFQWLDVNKPAYSGFEETCVEAAMANAIAFSSGGTLAEAYKTYVWLVKLVGDQPTDHLFVWDLMLHTYGKIPGSDYNKYQTFFRTNIRTKEIPWSDQIRGFLNAGWIVLPVVDIPGQGNVKHTVTIYGYKIDDSGRLSIIYCDSDDGIEKRYYSYLDDDKQGRSFFYLNNLKKSEIIGFAAIKIIGRQP